MCNPALIPAAIALVGAGVSAHSQHQQGKFQAKVAQQNADLAAFDEADAKRRGAVAEERHREKVRAMIGAQRAAFGANNVMTNSGTPLGLLAETAQMGEEDALMIRNNAAREAYGVGVERVNSRTRARMYRRGGSQDAAGTALAGGANAYGMWASAGG
jgi:hypothetical protein